MLLLLVIDRLLGLSLCASGSNGRNPSQAATPIFSGALYLSGCYISIMVGISVVLELGYAAQPHDYSNTGAIEKIPRAPFAVKI